MKCNSPKNHVVAATPRHRGVVGDEGGGASAGASRRKPLRRAAAVWLRKERIKAEASQVASAGPPQASQRPAGYRAKPAPAQAQAVPKQRTPAQLARNERSRKRLFHASNQYTFTVSTTGLRRRVTCVPRCAFGNLLCLSHLLRRCFP